MVDSPCIQRKETIYFESGGPDCTDATLDASIKRAGELGITHIVVASSSGSTALKLASKVQGLNPKVKVVAVTYHAGYKKPDQASIPEKTRSQLESLGVDVVVATHALSGLSRSFSNKFGGTSIPEIIAEAYRRISQGFKVAIECSVMAADAGKISTLEDVIAIGGSGSGCDTALVLRPANMNRFFELKVREIIAMPR